MTPSSHASFTAALLSRLAADPDVLGLVTLGSTSGLPPPPDAFSDHDFFVVTRPGAQERLRTDLSWLPDAADIVLRFRETAHGLKVLYASGHLAEFAVFDPDELALARVNRYRVLLDRADVAARLAATRTATLAATTTRVDEAWHIGQLLTCLVAGVGRAARGEHLSGHHLVRVAALSHLVALLHARHRGDPGTPLDDLDPHRRLEQALPAAGAALDRALRLPAAAAARALVDLAAAELPGLIPAGARAALDAVVVRATPTSPPPLAAPPRPDGLDLVLRTPRLVLRPLVEADAAALWPLVSNPELPRYMSWAAHLDPQETLDFVRRGIEGRLAGHDLKWVIEHQGRASGIVGLDGVTRTYRAWRLDRGELGYWLDPALWGRGLMTEAAGAVTRFAFETLALHKVTVGCIEENVASRRVIEKLGFRFLARHVDDVWRDGRWWSHLRYELTRADWRVARAPAITVQPMVPADVATFLAHYDAYVGDIAAAGGSYRRDAAGRWEPDYLPYWLGPGDDHHVLIILEGERAVGFALVLDAASPHIPDGVDFCLSELYVAPEARNRGVGAAAARAVFDRHRGRWELSEVPGNTGAIRFWRRLLADYTGGAFTEVEGPTQRFDNRVRGW